MKALLFVALAACLALVSCERVKKFLGKAGGVAKWESRQAPDEDSPAAEGNAVPPDPELAGLIDRTEEGVLFRRDLPFPGEVRVHVAEKEPMAVRLFQKSEVGKQSTTTSSVRQLSMEIRRTAGSLRFSRFSEIYYPAVGAEQGITPGPIKGHPLLPPVPPKDHTMVFRDGRWAGVENSGLAESILTRQLGPHVPAMFQEYALSPRPMWFGKRRIAAGKPMEISGELLPMLVAGTATGALTITLEDIESVHGHPCGRFSIKGSYQRKGFPFPDGRLFDEDTSIQSGHVWMSVLHPIILQYRIERIVTVSVAEGSGPAIRYQGNTRPMRSIEWKAVE